MTCSADKNIRIWGLDFGDCHKSIFAHDDSIMCVQVRGGGLGGGRRGGGMGGGEGWGDGRGEGWGDGRREGRKGRGEILYEVKRTQHILALTVTVCSPKANCK